MKKTYSKRGFTLVETLVAIGILVVAITGVFSAAQSGLSSSIQSKNQAIAINLAQEAVEYIRAQRDSNQIAGRNWLYGLEANQSGVCTFNVNCILSVLQSSENASCGGSACPVLRQDPTNGYYGYTSGWTPTVFRRDVKLVSVSSNEIAILVTVTWNKGVITKIYKTRESLFNW
jgi:prepilin-type N-terminal cleavage/methylation domain-containing protein